MAKKSAIPRDGRNLSLFREMYKFGYFPLKDPVLSSNLYLVSMGHCLLGFRFLTIGAALIC